MITLATLTVAAGVMLLLAVAMSLVLGWANRAFHVPIDPRVERINRVLPAANCGGCGYIGCGEYSEAVARGEAPVDLCAPGGPTCAQAVAAVMGVDVEPGWPYRAVVHCAATTEMRLGRTGYRGEPTCSAANLVTDVQGCVYGCLGLSDCVDVCIYDAIHVIDGVARVDYENCTGCGACIDACPRGIISRVPFKAERILAVACSNQDFGADVRKVCKIGCVGCTACSKLNELIGMSDNLPTIDYERYDPAGADFSASVDKCPMESLVWIGKPSAADLDATADEVLPDIVRPEFDTTVDRTRWWG